MITVDTVHTFMLFTPPVVPVVNSGPVLTGCPDVLTCDPVAALGTALGRSGLSTSTATARSALLGPLIIEVPRIPEPLRKHKYTGNCHARYFIYSVPGR